MNVQELAEKKCPECGVNHKCCGHEYQCVTDANGGRIMPTRGQCDCWCHERPAKCPTCANTPYPGLDPANEGLRRECDWWGQRYFGKCPKWHDCEGRGWLLVSEAEQRVFLKSKPKQKSAWKTIAQGHSRR